MAASSFDRTFQSVELDISNAKIIGSLSDKSNKMDSFRKLLKPSIHVIITAIIKQSFSSDPQQIRMESKHDFIILDSHYEPIASIVPNLDKLFKKDCDYETDQRLGEYIKTCQIRLSDFKQPKKQHYCFFFLINRDVYPFNLFFLGCKYIDIIEDEPHIFYIKDLVRLSTENQKTSVILSKKKKDEKKYRDKLMFVDTI